VYKNLFPEDSPSIHIGFRLEERKGKWVTVATDGSIRTATGRYLFVTRGGMIYVSRQYIGRVIGHCDISGGADVDYAGEIQFSGRKKRGQIRWWTNRSGHYKPDESDADEAGLPIGFFRQWQEVPH
jgi:filamentous hemagglutinin